jgi:putative chitinase
MNREAFFNSVRSDFGKLKQPQVDGFNVLLDAWAGRDPRFTAYALATAWHETAKTMQPIREYGKGKGKKYGVPVNGQVYYGRGYVQLTWHENYAKAKSKLGVDFVGKPDLVMQPKHAAAIMVRGMTEGWFTGKKLSTYFNKTKDDPVQARKIINGLDKAELIADYHRKFLAAVNALGAAPPLPPPPPPPEPEPEPAPPAPPPEPPKTIPKSKTLWTVLVGFIASITGALSDWKVATVICVFITLAAFLFIGRERIKKILDHGV